MARFVGGSLDGETKTVTGGREFVVPVAIPSVGNILDVIRVPTLGDALSGRHRRPAQCPREIYVRSFVDGACVYTYDRTETR